MVVLGENSIVDISDPNEGSHLNLLNEKQQEQVEELFTCELNYENLYSKQLRKIVKVNFITLIFFLFSLL